MAARLRAILHWADAAPRRAWAARWWAAAAGWLGGSAQLTQPSWAQGRTRPSSPSVWRWRWPAPRSWRVDAAARGPAAARAPCGRGACARGATGAGAAGAAGAAVPPHAPPQVPPQWRAAARGSPSRHSRTPGAASAARLAARRDAWRARASRRSRPCAAGAGRRRARLGSAGWRAAERLADRLAEPARRARVRRRRRRRAALAVHAGGLRLVVDVESAEDMAGHAQRPAAAHRDRLVRRRAAPGRRRSSPAIAGA
ncbi:MAG: hypothetical protein MZW92_56750 [Comamonadaceae bacterium]|nr:hypothetical protein [Comamonadaceae bacterium]